MSGLAQRAGAGFVFGAALTASEIYLRSVIVSQMELEDFHMLNVFLAASASSAYVVLHHPYDLILKYICVLNLTLIALQHRHCCFRKLQYRKASAQERVFPWMVGTVRRQCSRRCTPGSGHGFDRRRS